MIKTPWAIVAILLLLVGAIGLAACGGGDDDDDTTSGDDAQASASSDPGDDSGDDGEDPTDAPEETDAPDDGGDDDDDDDGGNSGGDFDSCVALTQEEVEAALGVSVQAPVQTYASQANLPNQTLADVGTCNYVSPEGADSISVSLWSAPGDEDGVEQMVSQICAGKEELDAGDQACWYDDSHVEVQVRVGGNYADIFATVTTSGDSTAVLEQLAANAANNLD